MLRRILQTQRMFQTLCFDKRPGFSTGQRHDGQCAQNMLKSIPGGVGHPHRLFPLHDLFCHCQVLIAPLGGCIHGQEAGNTFVFADTLCHAMPSPEHLQHVQLQHASSYLVTPWHGCHSFLEQHWIEIPCDRRQKTNYGIDNCWQIGSIL